MYKEIHENLLKKYETPTSIRMLIEVGEAKELKRKYLARKGEAGI